MAATGAPPSTTRVDADHFIFRDRSNDAIQPWDIIDGGMKQSFFRAEFDKSTSRRVDASAEARRENAEADCD